MCLTYLGSAGSEPFMISDWMDQTPLPRHGFPPISTADILGKESATRASHKYSESRPHYIRLPKTACDGLEAARTRLLDQLDDD